MAKVEVGSVREIHKRLLDEGYRVGQSALRAWIKSGVLPAVRVGNKSLIAYTNVVEILLTGGSSVSADS